MSTHLANVLSNASNIECFSLAIAELLAQMYVCQYILIFLHIANVIFMFKTSELYLILDQASLCIE